jgi:2-keto-4-pentenoate hydratase/2-oxohepta-3-ene-1,7-dioic acid hydratase in catechol pathway
MRYARLDHNGRVRYGVLENDRVRLLDGDPFARLRETGEFQPLAAVRLLAPCVPTKIVAIGVNYRDHAAEFKKELPKEPLIFLKPPSSIISPGDAIVHPKMSRRVDYEAELAVVIGRRARHIGAEQALAYVHGFTCINDVTARDLQKSDGQWTRAKGFDTFSPLGPCIATGLDPGDLAIKSYLNGELRQSARTSDLVFGVAQLVSFVSQVMTLLPGDIIATGTPAGVGPMRPGDRIEVEIEGIGRLTNTVVADESA